VPCRLLALPAKLRLQIYEDCLAPTGTLHQTSSATYHRTRYYGAWIKQQRTLSPIISPALFSTYRRIHNEAQEVLYKKNTICVVVDMKTSVVCNRLAGYWLSLRLLRNIHRLSLILDCTQPLPKILSLSYLGDPVFTALGSLKHVRVAAIFDLDADARTMLVAHRTVGKLLCLLRHKLPARVQLQLEVAPGSSEERLALNLAEQRQVRFSRSRCERVETANLTTPELVEIFSRTIHGMRKDGAEFLLSGSLPNVFIEYRLCE
jgi:hypothetical protein